MISIRAGAILATLIAAVTASAPASACRVTAVEGYSGGPSVIRIAANRDRPCAIPHYTITNNGRGTRVLRTLTYRPIASARHGRVALAGNRVIYRGRSPDRFAYDLTDRVGYEHQVRVTVARR